MTRKLVHEGNYAAEADVEIMDTGKGWSPHLSIEDAYKLNEVLYTAKPDPAPRGYERNIFE